MNRAFNHMSWQEWLPLAMAGQLSEAELDACLPQLTLKRLSEPDLMALWAYLAGQLPSIPAINDLAVRFDCCGTGGSGLSHFNISTTVSFIVAAAGIPVIKFGNRSATSKTGSFDFLSGLGLDKPIAFTDITRFVEQYGQAFLFAPMALPGLKHLAAARKRLGTKTVFNLLGPLLNPVRPTHQLLGSSMPQFAPWQAECLRQQNVSGWVVCGHQQQDDLTPWGTSQVWPVDSAAFSLSGALPMPDLTLEESVQTNTERFWSIVRAEDCDTPWFHATCLNAGAALHIVDKATGLSEGVALARSLLAERRVYQQVKRVQAAYAHYA